jgi:hypothetical protein
VAKHYVLDFSIHREKRENDIEEVILEIKTEIAKKFKYALSEDTRQPTLEWIEKLLTTGLTYAKKQHIKIDINEYLERNYLFIRFPKDAIESLGYVDSQFTAVRVP